MVVDLSHRDFACLNGFLEFVSEEIIERLFMVQSSSGGLHGAVRSTPVGQHETLESPTLFEHIREQIFVLTGKVAIYGVVGAHYGCGISDFDADLESKKVTLTHGA